MIIAMVQAPLHTAVAISLARVSTIVDIKGGTTHILILLPKGVRSILAVIAYHTLGNKTRHQDFDRTHATLPSSILPQKFSS
jgi:hypothetical protein